MRTDKLYSVITICPDTERQIHKVEVMHNHGVCVQCGHDNGGTVGHYKNITGRWNRPSILEWLNGERKKFINK